MRGLYATAALWATLALIAPSGFEASFASATDAPEKTVPQGARPAWSRERRTAEPADRT